MSEEEWKIVTAWVNFCRTNDILFAEVEREGFKVTLKTDDEGFDLGVERAKGG